MSTIKSGVYTSVEFTVLFIYFVMFLFLSRVRRLGLRKVDQGIVRTNEKFDSDSNPYIEVIL